MTALVILRGLPGAGKTTLARRDYPAAYRDRAVCSADECFVGRDGVYRFSAAVLPAAHQACFLHALACVARRAPLIVVDNVNAAAAEIAGYHAVGTSFRYAVTVREVACDPEVAYRRQTHGVPRDVFERMRAALAVPLPAGWRVERVAADGALS